MDESKELAVKGAIIGQLVGDALGYHYRFAKYDHVLNLSEVEMLPGPQEFRQEGTYTNSSAMALATMVSINEYNQINIDDMLERFYDCVIGGYMNIDEEDYYVSPLSSQAVKNFSNGSPWDRCGIKNDIAQAEEDDILLRILPVALWLVGQDAKVYLDEVHRVTLLTHAVPRCLVCSALYALVVRNLLLQKPEKIFEILADYYKNGGKSELLDELAGIKASSDSPPNNIVGTFWVAWKIFSANQNNYKLAVSKSVRCRNPNVVAGVVGSWVALQSGLNDIPLNWLKSLKLSAEAMETAENFVRKSIQRY
jgi:ADP-ribosyl-[dinitrogen reductase] hydrolase